MIAVITIWQTIGHAVYRTVGVHVTGRPLISLIAGTLTTIVVLAVGVSYAVALGVIVSILNPISFAGATIAAASIGTAALLHSITAGIVLAVVFIIHRQIENRFQPVIYGRTQQLSPLEVPVSVLVGAQLDPDRLAATPARDVAEPASGGGSMTIPRSRYSR